MIAITITQNSRGKGEEEDSISVSNSCYHRGKGHQFQKMCLPTRVILFWRFEVKNSILMIAKFRKFETYFHVFLDW